MDLLLENLEKAMKESNIQQGSGNWRDYERMKWVIRDMSLNYADYDRAIKYVVDYLNI